MSMCLRESLIKDSIKIGKPATVLAKKYNVNKRTAQDWIKKFKKTGQKCKNKST